MPLGDISPTHLVDLVDEIFVVADPAEVRAATCDPERWQSWFPGAVFTPYDDRGPLGARWTVTGALRGTAEVWLEEHGDGSVVHAYLRVDPAERSRGRQRRDRVVAGYARPLKRRLFELKDLLEGDREPGTPRVPWGERVVSASDRRPTRGPRKGATPDG